MALNSNTSFINLSWFISDGDQRFWPVSTAHQVAREPGKLLKDISNRVNLDTSLLNIFGTQPVEFTTMPKGYKMYARPRPKGRRSKKYEEDHYVYGHPTGRHFRSYKAFLPHAIAIAIGRLSTCNCANCPGWRAKLAAKSNKHTAAQMPNTTAPNITTSLTTTTASTTTVVTTGTAAITATAGADAEEELWEDERIEYELRAWLDGQAR